MGDQVKEHQQLFTVSTDGGVCMKGAGNNDANGWYQCMTQKLRKDELPFPYHREYLPPDWARHNQWYLKNGGYIICQHYDSDWYCVNSAKGDHILYYHEEAINCFSTPPEEGWGFRTDGGPSP